MDKRWLPLILLMVFLAIFTIFQLAKFSLTSSKEPKAVSMVEKNLKSADVPAPDEIKDMDGRVRMEK